MYFFEKSCLRRIWVSYETHMSLICDAKQFLKKITILIFERFLPEFDQNLFKIHKNIMFEVFSKFLADVPFGTTPEFEWNFDECLGRFFCKNCQNSCTVIIFGITNHGRFRHRLSRWLIHKYRSLQSYTKTWVKTDMEDFCDRSKAWWVSKYHAAM